MSSEKTSRYLEYLPAIYQEEAIDAVPFLGRFLLPFEEVLTGFEGLLSTIDRYVSPALTDPEVLFWLASWVALVLDDEWDESKRRSLINEAVILYRQRGTVKGLKRYLEIYTGLVPDILECRWPRGMQIGVASQVGWTDPAGPIPARIGSVEGPERTVLPNYYVVETRENGEVHHCYYADTTVQEVTVGDNYVEIRLLSDELIHHEPAAITRRDGLVEHAYTVTPLDESGAEEGVRTKFRGDTFLIDEEEVPYCFIVDVRIPLGDMERVDMDRVRAIVDLEKPAHTRYYLRLTPVLIADVFEMQIGVRSTIGDRHIIIG